MYCSVRMTETQSTAIRNLRLVKIGTASGQARPGRPDLVPRIILSQRAAAAHARALVLERSV